VFHPIDESGSEVVVDTDESSIGTKPRGCRFSLRSMLIAFVVIALLLGLSPMLIGRLIFGVGPVWFSGSWPGELHAFMDALPESDRAKVNNVKVYCLQDFIDTHHIWRFNIPKQGYDSLRRGFNTITLSTLDDRYFWEHPRVRWWDPDPKVDADYVEWFGFEYEVVTMYDKKHEVLYGYSQND
jgi:hypothetical protein